MKLSYFEWYGEGEAVRMMLTQAGIEFEDHRVLKEEWATLKDETHFGDLPILELDDGTKLYKATPIINYIASLCGFEPKDPMQLYKGNMLYESIFQDCLVAKFPKAMFGYAYGAEGEEAKW
jgi:glutathione S-transferase